MKNTSPKKPSPQPKLPNHPTSSALEDSFKSQQPSLASVQTEQIVLKNTFPSLQNPFSQNLFFPPPQQPIEMPKSQEQKKTDLFSEMDDSDPNIEEYLASLDESEFLSSINNPNPNDL